MPPTSDELTGDEGRAGLNRRQMIKAAGIAGAAAWTAPMIIDSLSSPAAAGTVTPGCYAFWLPFNTCSLTATDPIGGACTPTPDGTCTSTSPSVPAGAVTPPACPGNNTQTAVTISVNGGISCRITSVSAYVHHSDILGTSTAQCRMATTSATVGNTAFTFGSGNRSVTIDPGTSGAFPFPADFWRNGGTTPPNSAIGIVLHCP